MNETVYISFPKNTQVNTARVSIGDCASVWCEDAHITARVKAITSVSYTHLNSITERNSKIDMIVNEED